jgi:hypothetical protein
MACRMRVAPDDGAVRAEPSPPNPSPVGEGDDRPGRPPSGKIQPDGEIRSNKSKQMKGNESKIAFICFQQFLRIGTFQWVMGKKIRKSPLPSTRVSGCESRALRAPSAAPFLPRRLNPRALSRQITLGKYIARVTDLGKILSVALTPPFPSYPRQSPPLLRLLRA